MHSAEFLVYQWQGVGAKGNANHGNRSVAFMVQKRLSDEALLGQWDNPASDTDLRFFTDIRVSVRIDYRRAVG